MKNFDPTSPIQIVIVDDTPFIRNILKELIFRTEGMEVIGEAENGLEALSVIKEKKPQVVTMDIVMPEKNGIDTTKELLRELPETRVIACSTASHEKVISAAINAGCCDYITKPFTSEDMIQAIRRAVNNSADSQIELSLQQKMA